MGFEPTRAEHNGLAVHRLNHSATSSAVLRAVKEELHFRMKPWNVSSGLRNERDQLHQTGGQLSVVERMLCMYEAPGSIPGISKPFFFPLH